MIFYLTHSLLRLLEFIIQILLQNKHTMAVRDDTLGSTCQFTYKGSVRTCRKSVVGFDS